MPAYKDNKTGKWYAKFYYKDWQGTNKQKWKRGFTTKKDATEYEREFLTKEAANPSMTFTQLYEIYMDDMTGRLKSTTMEHKKNIVGEIINVQKNVSPKIITLQEEPKIFILFNVS